MKLMHALWAAAKKLSTNCEVQSRLPAGNLVLQPSAQLKQCMPVLSDMCLPRQCTSSPVVSDLSTRSLDRAHCSFNNMGSIDVRLCFLT